MTKLIPLDAAIAAIALGHTVTQHEKALRAVPAIDPAAIREAALREAAYVAINACLVPPDGGNPTEEERLVCEEAYRRILDMIGEKK